MKLFVGGSRQLFERQETFEGLVALLGVKPTSLIHGGARGVDMSANQWALDRDIPITVVKPNWETYGKAAGQIRNREMVNEAECAIIIWDGVSPGTKGSLAMVQSKGIPYVLLCRSGQEGAHLFTPREQTSLFQA